jgi:hypothetical protein
MKKISILILLGSFTFVLACNKNDEETAKKLIGYWQLQAALRNDRPTESLDDMYLEFTTDGKLRTNVGGSPEEGTYALKRNQISQRNTSVPADYVIETIEDSNLVLSTELRGYAFRFTFKKMASNSSGASDTTTQQPQQ